MSIGIDKRIQVNTILESQLPEFLRSDFPLAADFLKQYYLSQEFQGGVTDLIDNLDQYLKVDNLVPEVIFGSTVTESALDIIGDRANSDTLTVASTKGFPDTYGLLKIGNEILTYTSKTSTTFIGLIRGFSGITGYDVGISTSLDNVNKQGLIFEETKAESHASGSTVTNLSVLFIQKFYKKLKKTFLPGLEDNDFVNGLDVGNFIKNARSFYQSKGIEESIKILLKVLFGEESIVLDLEERLVKPSSSEFIRREVIIAEPITGDPSKLVGQTITKSTDLATSGSVSEVEILTRDNKVYYKISLFVGFNDRDLIQGIFTIPGKTKVLETTSVGEQVLSVDSTVGFAKSGYVLCGINSITYTSKSVNQFFGCSGIVEEISPGSDARADEVIFGYEDGDLTKRVDLRITGVLSEFKTVSDIALVQTGEKIYVKNVGESIDNPSFDKTYKQIFSNSWIYNTSCRYKVEEIVGSTFRLSSLVDKSSLKKGDRVEILQRNSETVIIPFAEVTSVGVNNNEIELSGISAFTPSIGLYYDIRRKLSKASAVAVEIEEGNSKILADVSNVYVDDDKDAYVASNSLPSYTLGPDVKISTIGISSALPNLKDYNNDTKDYGIIEFPSANFRLITGDAVVYTSENPLEGLQNGETYYLEKLVMPANVGITSVRLYSSRSLIFTPENCTRVGSQSTVASHNLTKLSHFGKNLSANKTLRKFPLQQNLYVAGTDETPLNEIGMLIDGTQVQTPISDDYIYYGPLDSVDVYNSGDGYDVINPPKLVLDSSFGGGVDALIEPVIEGNVKEVFVDPHDFDIEEVKAITLTGGNGTGCILEPTIGIRFREIEFDTRDIFFSGGVSIEDETISFKTDHFLAPGETIFYNSNGNSELGIGPFKDNSNTATGTLATGAPYNVRIINSRTVQLHNSREEALAGINTIGISTATTASGIHKFRTVSKKTLQSVNVVNSGSGYQYRKLHVKASDISPEYAKINFKGHGFTDGDVVEYTTEGTQIGGLIKSTGITTTTNFYQILKVDNDSFRLADAGIGTQRTELNYQRRNYIELESQGTGYQTFKYPDIEVNCQVSFGSTVTGTFNFTPIITGSIVHTYLYEKGSKYGSIILNHQRSPKVEIKNGKNGVVKASVVGTKIVDVHVLNRGSEYNSPPEIKIESVGMTTTGVFGNGAILKPVVVDGKLTDVKVINAGIGYTADKLTLSVVPRGSNALFEPRVRRLTIDNGKREGNYCLSSNGSDNLHLSVHGYSSDISNSFGDDGTNHSPIIGWAYDGNPIYGPYAYTDTNKLGPTVGIVTSGYKLDKSKVVDRPVHPEFVEGFFVEDWQFNPDDGNLDEHNGRFCKTDEFPNGVYAYFASVSESSQTNTMEPSFPYFIGKTYRSPFISSNTTLSQEFDFNNSNLSRNTFPYKVGDALADNDFIVESNEFLRQLTTVESVTTGEIDSLQILDGGTGYKVGDFTNFDNTGTSGTGLRGQVKSIAGIGVSSITTQLEKYENSIFTWKNGDEVVATFKPFIELNDKDTVSISGLSSSVTHLTNSFSVGITTHQIGLAKSMTANAIVQGRVDDLYVNIIPDTVSIGSTLRIDDDELVKVLNIYDIGSILRVRRFGVGAAHTYGSRIDILNQQITIPVKTDRFESSLNDEAFFNARQSVGVGTTAGGGITVDYVVGETVTETPIPTRTIYIPNHPFKTGQELTFTKKGTASSLVVGDTDQPTNLFNIPNVTTDVSTVYAINKGEHYVGLVTQRASIGSTSEGLFFHGNGSDDFEYHLETNHKQVTGDINKITSTIVTKIGAAGTTTHGLSNGDVVNLTVVPNNVVGLGSTAALGLKYNTEFQKLLVNEVGFSSSGINTITSTITVPDHGYETGDRLLYEGKTYSNDDPADGLNNSCYYVYKLSDDTFRLAETLKDIESTPTRLVGITSTGGLSHTISLINPQVKAIKNAKLSFNVSDSSLNGYDLKFFYDQNFKNEFISAQDSSIFNRSGVGTVGVGTTSTISVSFTESTPSSLYYAIEKGGYISTADPLVQNYSEIKFVDSVYSGDYKIFGISSDTFKISPRDIPELMSYQEDECELIEYSTESKTVSGPINHIRIISKGYDYKSIPKFNSIVSLEGKNANVVALSTSVGRIRDVRIVDIGYEYPSDKTLNPEAFVSPVLRIDNVDTIKEIRVIDGGNQYLSSPDVIVYDPQDDKIVDETSTFCITPNQSISSVQIIAPIQGLNSVNHRIITVNNSNGVGINSMAGSSSGIVTCTLETPIAGFDVPPFTSGDEVFVEGVELFGEAGIGTQGNAGASGIDTGGTGYNSQNYQFNFFRVEKFTNSNPAVLEYSIAGLTTNPGIAKTFQSGYASIINKSNYPIFDVVQERGKFTINEPLFIEQSGSFISKDLKVVESREDFIKIDGTYKVKVGDRLKGSNSNVSATVTSIIGNQAKFKVDYANRQEYGWDDNIGKLNEDFQVLPNNDYYQNLSYSIKSSVTWDKLVDPVNRLVHPSGLKNFADVGITTNVNVGLGTTVQATPIIVVDLLADKRVDTINNFDLARDFDARPENDPTKSKFITFDNLKLTDFTKCKTNRVLIHDDISGKFSSKGFKDLFTEIEEVENNFTKYLIQIVDADTQDVQFSELAVLTTTLDAYIVEKTSDFSKHKLGDFTATSDLFGRKTLVFTPTEKYERDHDIKILKTEFVSNAITSGTKSIGSVDLTGANVKVAIAQTDSNDDIVGFTTTIIAQFPETDFNGLFGDFVLQDDITKTINFAEVTIDFDGTDIYYAETYVDTLNSGYSASRVGVLTARYDSGTIYLECENQTKNEINVSANIVGLGTTTSGISTYRYAVPGQPDGAERSARLESIYNTGTSTPILVTRIDNRIDSTVKSIVRTRNQNNKSAVHQVVTLQDSGDVTTIQYPYLGSSSSGIGTFGSVTDGDFVNVNFYPDTGETTLIEVQSFNTVFNTVNDFVNTPDKFEVGPAAKELFLSAYDGINGDRANKVNFEIEHEGIPVYQKTFNPNDVNQLNYVSGEFTIPDHFFNDNEELTYAPGSSFIGVGATPVSIGSTLNNAGIVTTLLPEKVYVKITDENKFKLYSRKEYINTGVAITFTGVGEGNAHTLDMTKKLSKTVIGLDGIVQQPITYTTIEHTIRDAIGAGTSQFVLSGISSVQPRDVLKIQNEYMKVEQVGFSSLPEGTINDSTDVALGISTLPVVRVRRGSLGIGATPHSEGIAARVHRGSFNIVDSTVWFLDPPKGNSRERRNDTNLPYVKAEFSGRTFLRQNYDTNMIFDDVSDSFTGIGKTYTVTVGGANTETGVGIGNGILFINGVFQTPLTLNNAGNNYEFDTDAVAGISSVVFTGITSENGTPMQSEFDINQNQLPRGGLIVSMGSTPGLGYAPLVGASVKPKIEDNTNLFAAGSITDIVGIGTSSKYSLGIQTASYDNKTGIITVTTNEVHGYALGYPKTVHLKDLEFKCPTKDVGTPVTGGTVYDPSTGELTIKIVNHGLQAGDAIKFKKESLVFSCTFGSGGSKSYPRETDPAFDKYLYIDTVTPDTFKVNALLGTTPTNTDPHTFVSATPNAVQTLNYVGLTTSYFQDHERALPVIGIVSERTFEVEVGLTTIPHIYHGGGYAYEFYNGLTFGSGYRNPVSVSVTDIEFEHKFVSSDPNSITANGTTNFTPTNVDYISSTGELILTLGNNHGLSQATKHDIQGATYNPSTGVVTLTAGVLTNGHGFSNGDWVKIADESLTFTCTMDGGASQKLYPRASDPISGKWIQISNVTQFTFDINVGSSPGVSFTPSNAHYDPVTGLMELVIGSHTLRPGTSIKLAAESVKFFCDVDNNSAEKAYPRVGDPAYDTAVKIESVTDTSITIQTLSTTPSTNTSKHTFASANPNAVTTGGNYSHTFVTNQERAEDALSRAIDTITIATGSLVFTCSRDNHSSNHPYPRTTDPADGVILGIEDSKTNTISVNVGSGGGGGTGAIIESKVAVNKHKFESAVANGVTVSYGTTTITDASYDPATGEMIIRSDNHNVSGASTITPTSASYVKNTGNLTLTKTNHGFSVGDKILIEDYGLTFTCSKDNNQTEHRYPRPTDYASGRWLEIAAVSTPDTFRVNVNPSPSADQFTHTFVPSKTVNGCIQKSNATATIAPGSIIFRCANDAYQTLHSYPRITDPAYNLPLPVGKVTINTMRLQVGKSPAGTGGALEFIIKDPGARYVNPEIITPEPIYENMPVVGISRLGIGKTEDTGSNLLLNLKVGAAKTSVGTARSMFEISEFTVARSGHSFAVGDKFKPVGLVVDKRLQKPLQEFELEVVQTFNDYFSAWQFGELDFIDSIGSMQNGTRKRFPLFFNGQLLSFEIDEDSVLGDQIDLTAVLLIFVNGVLQTPEIAYQFEGGTTFTFTESPMASDKVDVFFYKGQDGVDIELVNVNETLKIGDDVIIHKHPSYPDTIDQEKERTVKDILGSDLIETTMYRGVGINENQSKPLDWTKQKEDKIIKGELISKARETIEPQIYPTAKVIYDVTTTDGSGLNGGIFVDDAESFFYEDESNPALDFEDRYNVVISAVDALLMSPATATPAAISATVSNDGDIESLTINDSGSGYVGSAATISISAPIGVGIGTTEKTKYAVVGVSTFAEATATITDGKVTGTTITNIGLGYSKTNPPQCIVRHPQYETEKITSFSNVEGYTGIITGIKGESSGGGLLLRFFYTSFKSNANKLAVGYPILIKDTSISVGSGVTSVDNNDDEIVSIGSTFLDNIYKVHSFSQLNDNQAEITCNVLSTTNGIVGIATTGFFDKTNIGATISLGKITWGRLYNGTRSTSPISIGVTGLTVDAGLTTFPTIQRRNYGGVDAEPGLRNTGSIRIVTGI
tara:strand:+ start:1906 stop:16431 length:14526 start_codon:yes stop_codon:yes gene_type:complete